MGLCGIPWWTTDIGGFHGGNIESDDFKEFECLLDIVQFKELVNTLSTDIITLSYGTPTAIKMVEGKVVQILSSLDEDIDG